MPEIKNITAAEALERGIQQLNERRDAGIRDLEQVRASIVSDLKLHEEAVGSLSGLIERAKHAYVKDVTPHRPSKLVNLRLDLDGGNVMLVDAARCQSDYDNAPVLTCRPYRFWLLIEELPAEVPDAGA